MNLKSLLALIIAVCSSEIATAKIITGDSISTRQGDLIIHPILHSTLALQWNNKTIFIDPYGGEPYFGQLPDPDLIVITDIHGDHMNIETLEIVVKDNTLIVAPAAVVEQLPKRMQIQAHTLDNTASTKVLGIEVTAIAMYNLPETTESRHPKGRGNGYVLNIGGQRLYISGDTHDIPEMRALEQIDIAFVCMNPPNTMTVEAAADAVIEFSPRIVFPFHFRSRSGMQDIQHFEQLVNAGNRSIDVRIRDWYPSN